MLDEAKADPTPWRGTLEPVIGLAPRSIARATFRGRANASAGPKGTAGWLSQSEDVFAKGIDAPRRKVHSRETASWIVDFLAACRAVCHWTRGTLVTTTRRKSRRRADTSGFRAYQSHVPES